MTKTSAIKNSGFIKTAVLSVLNIVLSVFKPLSDISENSLTSNFIKNIPSQTNKTICQCTFNGIEDIINICEYTFRLEDVNEKLLFLFGIMALIFAYKKIIEKFITDSDNYDTVLPCIPRYHLSYVLRYHGNRFHGNPHSCKHPFRNNPPRLCHYLHYSRYRHRLHRFKNHVRLCQKFHKT